MEQEKEAEKTYSNRQAAAKLRRLADALEQKKSFMIQIAGQRISVPPHVTVEFEYSCDKDDEEVEIELKWKRK